MSEFIKNNRFSIAILIIVLALIIIRNTGNGRFRYNAERWALPTYDGSNIVSAQEIPLLKGNTLIILIDKDSEVSLFPGIKQVKAASDSLLISSFTRRIRSNEGPVLLYSSDYSVSAKAWMALSQTGMKNLYILSEDADNELSKEKFRPDTSTRPEQK